MRWIFSAIIGLIQLKTVSSQTPTCPQAGSGILNEVTFGNFLRVKKSVANSVCVLVHLRSKPAAHTRTLDDISNRTSLFGTDVRSVTNSSNVNDYILTPVARSYNGEEWERVAGPYSKKLVVKRCTSILCVLRIHAIEPYATTGAFYLMTFTNEKTFQEDLSRFFSQTTFGGTMDMIDNWAYTQDLDGMAQFVKDQTQLPTTFLREEFRRGADFSMKKASLGSAAVTPKHPCAQYSRWREYAFTSAGDFGAPMDVTSFSEGLFLVSVRGIPRTIMESFNSSDNVLGGAAEYNLGYRIGEDVGGQVLFKAKTGGYKSIKHGNPTVVMNDDAISRDSGIIVINLPERSTNFESIDAVLSPGIYDIPASGSIRMNVDISNDPDANCDAIGNLANYEKVLGRFPDDTYVWYNGFAEIDANTPDAAISDGGIAKRSQGIRYCSNVAKNFHNIESCFLSEEIACDGSPHHYYEPQPFKQNTIICGSPNEVANVPDAPNEETSIYQFHAVGPDTFYAAGFVQKMAVWYKTKFQAMDQLRHRIGWALSQHFVVTLNQIDNGDLWTEMFVTYEDIFVRNAFGTFKDILTEVSYSPMMAEMLSFLDSTSSMYALQREGRISRPDANYAREIMQLFTIGLYKMHMDGTYQRTTKGGELIQTYDNYDIETFARAWTGFQRQGPRSNYESFWWNPNKIDPMFLNGEKRDPFPKLDLRRGYIGDKYPLCKDLPSRQFLRKGATYRLVGNFNKPELTPETGWWNAHPVTTRAVLDSTSQLHEILCNSNGGQTCNYSTIVRLSEDIGCTGIECNVDTLTLVKVQNSPPLYYEYMPFPCIELQLSNSLAKVTNRYSKAMCAEKGVPNVVFDACCPAVPPATPYWIGKAWSNCEFTGEKVSYATNEERCTGLNGTVCDFEMFGTLNTKLQCHLGIREWINSWHWTNQTCRTQVKINVEGLVSIVHNPNLDINSVLAAKGQAIQTVFQPVSPDNKNFFKVNWRRGAYPVSGQCGLCQQVADGCLCDVVVREPRIFSSPPTLSEVVSKLRLGSPDPSWQNDYELVSESNGVAIYVLSREKAKFPKLTKRAVFGAMFRGEMRFFLNYNSLINVNDGNTTYVFNNPPSMMRLIEQTNHDAYYETEEVLNHYVYHPNTAPFIATQMIKRFVTSNPSPQFVLRVATAFTNGIFKVNDVEFGNGAYGSMEAMFAAIVLDGEARNSILDVDPSYGSLKEPILKLFAFMRAMEFKLHDKTPALRLNNDVLNKIGQEPFSSPNVFSFFLPDYAAPGAVKEASLVSPEAQIINAPTVVGFLNGIMSLIDIGLTECYGGFGMRTVFNCAGYRKTYDPERVSRGTLSYSPTSEITSEIVDELAMLLNGGRLTASSRLSIEAAYDEVIQAGGGREKALRMAQKLLVMTPEFHSTSVYQPIDEARPEPTPPDDPTNPYKALVYINLNGGLDSFNTLVPHSDCAGKDMFQEYQQVRGSVAVAKNTLHQISVSGQICNTFGVHEDLEIVKDLYDSGELSFFANMGVLQQPVTDKAKYQQLNKKTALFAHNVQQVEINVVDINDDSAGLGVCGRMADVLSLNGYSTGTVSVAGGAPAIVSESTPLLVVHPSGYEKFNSITWEPVDRNRIKELNKAASVGSNMFGEIWSEKLFQSISENDILFQQMSTATTTAKFESDALGNQMSSIAKLIKTRDARKTDRDVFYAESLGFDTHIVQDIDLSAKLVEINSALTSFVSEMKTQGLWEQVTVVFVSEFGRTLVSNTSNGTDHAWGGNYFAASGSMNGGKIHGDFPDDLTSSGSRIVSDAGIVVPTTSFEALWNGVAEWFGVSSTNDLNSVLPNRGTFSDNLFTASELFN